MRYIDKFENIEVIMGEGDKLPSIYVNKELVPIYLNNKESNPKRYFVIDAINIKTGKKNQVLVHKLIADTLVKKEDEKDDRIIFIDGNRLNYHPNNLKWTTSSKEMKIKNEKVKKDFIKTKEENKLNKKVIDNLNKDKKDYRKAIIGISVVLLMGIGYIIFKFM